MERLLFRIIAAGFVLLTLTLAAACCSPRSCSASRCSSRTRSCSGSLPGASSPRCSPGASSTAGAGALALRWTLAGFLALVLAYIGSKFVLEVILQRAERAAFLTRPSGRTRY